MNAARKRSSGKHLHHAPQSPSANPLSDYPRLDTSSRSPIGPAIHGHSCDPKPFCCVTLITKKRALVAMGRAANCLPSFKKLISYVPGAILDVVALATAGKSRAEIAWPNRRSIGRAHGYVRLRPRVSSKRPERKNAAQHAPASAEWSSMMNPCVSELLLQRDANAHVLRERARRVKTKVLNIRKSVCHWALFRVPTRRGECK
jgi:hypothetical protein